MYIKVRVSAGAKREVVEEVANGRFDISVKQKPERNAANARIRAIVAALKRVPVNRVRIVSGHQSPSKLLEIIG